MLKVIAQDFIKLEAVETVLPLYRELVEKTRREDFCIAYDLFIDQKDPGHFIFIEEWPDRAALDAHCRTEHFTRLVPLINAHQRQKATFILMEAFPACLNQECVPNERVWVLPFGPRSRLRRNHARERVSAIRLRPLTQEAADTTLWR